MKDLFHNCSRSRITVSPSNWNTVKASVKIKWRITYRFYDPLRREKYKKGLQVSIKGMNRYETLKERQTITKKLIETESYRLDVQGWNPITGLYMAPALTDQVKEIGPGMPLSEALQKGFEKLTMIHTTLLDVKSVLKTVNHALPQLYCNANLKPYNALPVGKVTSVHIEYLFEQCVKNNPKITNNRFNKYRTYLGSIFKVLKKFGAVKTNPCFEVEIKKVEKKIKTILTPDEQALIDAHLKTTDYYFWRYMRIFFRSGARTTELLALRKDEKVDLNKQEFIVLVKKGKNSKEHIKPIPTDILPLWKEIWREATPGQFLFSTVLKPGDTQINKDFPNKRWKKLVKAQKKKGGLNIQKDFYSLKHLHADMIAKQLSISHAQTALSHGDSETTGIYTVGQKGREREELKNLKVEFGEN